MAIVISPTSRQKQAIRIYFLKLNLELNSFIIIRIKAIIKVGSKENQSNCEEIYFLNIIYFVWMVYLGGKFCLRVFGQIVWVWFALRLLGFRIIMISDNPRLLQRQRDAPNRLHLDIKHKVIETLWTYCIRINNWYRLIIDSCAIFSVVMDIVISYTNVHCIDNEFVHGVCSLETECVV